MSPADKLAILSVVSVVTGGIMCMWDIIPEGRRVSVWRKRMTSLLLCLGPVLLATAVVLS